MHVSQNDDRDCRWSTDEALQQQSPLDAFTEIVSAEIAEMAVESDLKEAFRASWVRYGLGPLAVNFLQCDPQQTSRSVAMATRDRKPYFELLYARTGRIQVNHGGLNSEVPPGAFVLLSNQLAFTLNFPDGSNCLAVQMPDSWLRSWVPDPQSLIGTPLGIEGAWSRPLSGLLTAIADSGLESISLPRFVLADQLGAFCSLLTQQTQDGQKHQPELATRIKHRIIERYQNHTLTPTIVADDLGISTRHLHRILTNSGTSYSSLLISTRLDRAAQLLASPAHSNIPINEIAWLVGFVDQSHFARLFKAAYGYSPSKFRTGALNDPIPTH